VPSSEVAEGVDRSNSADVTGIASLAAMASHAWRLSRLSRRAIERLPGEDAARHANQLRYIERQIEEELVKAGLKVVDLDGQAFDAGTAATALNAADFEAGEALRIAQTLEPVVVGRDGLLRYGVVMLGRIE